MDLEALLTTITYPPHRLYGQSFEVVAWLRRGGETYWQTVLPDASRMGIACRWTDHPVRLLLDDVAEGSGPLAISGPSRTALLEPEKSSVHGSVSSRTVGKPIDESCFCGPDSDSTTLSKPLTLTLTLTQFEVWCQSKTERR